MVDCNITSRNGFIESIDLHLFRQNSNVSLKSSMRNHPWSCKKGVSRIQHLVITKLVITTRNYYIRFSN